MKKIFYALLLLTTVHITPAAALIHSIWLDYDHTCNVSESFPIKNGDIVVLYSSLDIGDLVTIENTVVNPLANSDRHRWYFVNYNKKRLSRKYSQVFKTRIRIGAKPGWIQFKYQRLSIPTGNTVIFHINNNTYCRPHE